MRAFLFTVLLLTGCSNTFRSLTSLSESTKFSWKPLRIGAGGWIVGMDFSTDGQTKLIRTDTYGAYLWSASVAEWQQLITASSMPAGEQNPGSGMGVYEIRVAPSNQNIFYLAYAGFVYRSDDRGAHWARTNFTFTNMSPNNDFRMHGHKMAVDPVNPDIVIMGTEEHGVFITKNGGVTWQAINDIPMSTTVGGKYPGVTGIVFDHASVLIGGNTSRMYACSYGNGVYVSADAGTTWSRTSGGPTSAAHAAITPSGTLWVVDLDQGSNNVWKLSSGIWNQLNIGGGYHAVAIDPTDAAHIVLATEGSVLNVSHDGGIGWTGPYWPNYPTGAGRLTASDIPWLAWTEESYKSNGDIAFDGSSANKLYLAEGIGVWHTTVPMGFVGFDWVSQSKGIEQLVATQIASPPGGAPLVAAWDRPIFRVGNADAFPATHGPNNASSIIGGWSIDYASSNPNYVAGIFNWQGNEQSAYSSDGGQTWIPFATYPAIVNQMGGGIAISTPQNMIWVGSNNQNAYFTKTGGAMWTQIAISGIPTTGTTGWGFAYYLRRRIAAADRVAPNTFYLYNDSAGVYRSTDGGENWSLRHAGPVDAFGSFNTQMRTVPGQEGELYFTVGPQGVMSHPANAPLFHSIDGGITWTAIPNVLEVTAIGFGKSASKGGPATLFIVGYIDGAFGIYRSDDSAKTWVNLGAAPLGSLDTIVTIEGDNNTYGTVYLGFSGSGFAYGKFQ